MILYYSESLNRVGELTGAVRHYRLEHSIDSVKDLSPKTGQEPNGDLDALGLNQGHDQIFT